MNQFLKFPRAIAGAFLFSAFFVMQTHAALITVSPEKSEIAAVGGYGTVAIMISDLGDGVDLATFDLNIGYDAAVLDFVSYTLGDELGTIDVDALDGSWGAIADGMVNINEISLVDDLSGQSGIFKIVSLTFKGLASGVSSIVADGMLGDALCDEIAFTTTSGSMSVPEPQVTALLLLGLVPLPFLWNRKKNRV